MTKPAKHCLQGLVAGDAHRRDVAEEDEVFVLLLPSRKSNQDEHCRLQGTSAPPRWTHMASHCCGHRRNDRQTLQIPRVACSLSRSPMPHQSQSPYLYNANLIYITEKHNTTFHNERMICIIWKSEYRE